MRRVFMQIAKIFKESKKNKQKNTAGKGSPIQQLTAPLNW